MPAEHPLPLPLTVEAWMVRLQHAPLFDSSGERLHECAELMVAFMEGASWTLHTLASRGQNERLSFQHVPHVADSHAFALVSPICTRGDGTQITVHGPFLRELAGADLDAPHGFNVLVASPRDYFRLAGVEEADHVVALRRRLVQPVRRPDGGPGEYHASDVEYRALLAKLAFTAERGLPAVTRDTLRAIHGAAQGVRRARGLDLGGP